MSVNEWRVFGHQYYKQPVHTLGLRVSAGDQDDICQ